jgi:hypothetical protein
VYAWYMRCQTFIVHIVSRLVQMESTEVNTALCAERPPHA